MPSMAVTLFPLRLDTTLEMAELMLDRRTFYGPKKRQDQPRLALEASLHIEWQAYLAGKEICEHRCDCVLEGVDDPGRQNADELLDTVGEGCLEAGGRGARLRDARVAFRQTTIGKDGRKTLLELCLSGRVQSALGSSDGFDSIADRILDAVERSNGLEGRQRKDRLFQSGVRI